MQRDLLAEFHLPNVEFKTKEKIITHNSPKLSYALQENKEHVNKNSVKKSVLCNTTVPSMVSDVAPINNTLTGPKNKTETVNGQFVVSKPITPIGKQFKSDSKVVNLNTNINNLPRNFKRSIESPICYPAKKFNKNGNNKPTEIISPSTSLKPKSDETGKKSSDAGSNNVIETSNIQYNKNIIFLKNTKGNTKFQIKLGKDAKECSDPLSLNPKPKTPCDEDSEAVTENVSNNQNLYYENDSKPFCVISEVIGNADAAFSGEIDSSNANTKSTNHVSDRSLIKPKKSKNKESPTAVNVSQEICKSTVETVEITAERTDSTDQSKVVSCKENNEKKSDATVLEAETPTDEINIRRTDGVEIRERKTYGKKVQTDNSKRSPVKSPNAAKQSELQLITPKKTNDITKIKGWRRKQFLIEKPTTVEFYSIAKGSKQKKINVEDEISKFEEPGNVENAFVCDSLDEFLNGEVELKVGYEIPHLYAEVGIKLTKEEIASKPNLSGEDFKEVENRYCIPVKEVEDITNLDRIDEEKYKIGKRCIEDDIKPCKSFKLEVGKQRPDKFVLKEEEKFSLKTEPDAVCCKNTQNLKTSAVDTKLPNQFPTAEYSTKNFKLETKLLGLVVYPRPFKPLHPIVRHHLRKIRSYSTKIDKNWANFAVSAVFANDRKYKRRILPVRCCVKVEKTGEQCKKNDDKIIGLDSCFEKELSEKAKKARKSTKYSKEKIKLKECCVVVDKINLVGAPSPWCMEHHVYDCEPCGLSKSKLNNLKSPGEGKTNEKQKLHESKELVISPQNSFDVKIATLLAKKLRTLKFKGDTFTGIDCLKTLVPDSVEFIKLNFVKESFLNAVINMWYLKDEVSSTRSRAFLTFSDLPPVPNAVNLKCNTFSTKHLPKVITEIVSSDKVFSPNEYAILHCNGKIWEIHGSLNIAFDTSNKNVEQIFASSQMPELEELQKVAQDVLKVKAVKWWILDLTQKFRLIEIKFGNIVSIISRNRFIEMARCESHGFVPIRKDKKGRVLGAYIIGSLLPFVLMGPYYLVETSNMSLKGENSPFSFKYFVKENVTKDAPLKFFINSVIKDAEENNKVLDGLWLYDKICLDNTSYIEVVTKNSENSTTQTKSSSIDIDHGYSLNSLTNGLPQGNTHGVIKRKEEQEDVQKITVYLYFDVPELGYVEGELQRDNSVIISHPLDQRTKVKSHKVGEWFVRTIKRRIEFIPKDMEIKWFITKHKEDLRERRPFNKFLLGGAHVLTRNGLFYLLEMSESKIEKLGLEKSEVVKAITESQVIKVVLEMKNLAKLLSENGEGLSMEKVLTLAINEIKNLKFIEESLTNEKMKMEEKRLKFTTDFLEALTSCPKKNKVKLKMLKNIEHLYKDRNGDLNEEFVKKLIKYRIGRQYLRRNGKFCNYIEKVRDTGGSNPKVKKKRVDRCKRLQMILNSFKLAGALPVKSVIRKYPAKKKTTNTSDKNQAKENPSTTLPTLAENTPNTTSSPISSSTNTNANPPQNTNAV